MAQHNVTAALARAMRPERPDGRPSQEMFGRHPTEEDRKRRELAQLKEELRELRAAKLNPSLVVEAD